MYLLILHGITVKLNVVIDASFAGKNVAKINILHSWVNVYIIPPCIHFQNAPYSDLKK